MVILVGYVLIGFKLYHLTQTSQESERYKKMIRKVGIYPVIYVLCWVMAPAYDLYQITHGYMSPELATATVVVIGSNGLLNCLAYFFLRVYRGKLKTKVTNHSSHVLRDTDEKQAEL